jgi:glycosyltransferase involved in cell wall biosynthesis
MKILQLISSGGFYGAERVLVNLSVELERMGHPCTVGVFENAASPNMEVAVQSEAAGLKVVRISCRGQVDSRAIGVVRETILKQDAELVHAHGYKADFYAFLARRKAEVPLIATCHNWPGTSPKMRFYGWLDRLVLRSFDGVVAVSSAVADRLREAGVSKQMRLIPNGVPVPTGEDRPVAADLRQPGRLVVGAVGRLSKEKGTAVLIQAAARICREYPNVLFVQVGDGPDRKELEAIVRELGIESQFVFAGQRQDMAQVYRSFDLFALPSLAEGMPMALLEAMAAGLPVVATRVGAVPEVIGDPKAGTVVEAGDVEALARAIRTFLADEDLRRRAGAQAQKRLKEKFSAAAMAKEYVDLFQQVLMEWHGRKNAPTVSQTRAKRDLA